mmetsp:Transcript_21910/g.55231  ORF Transcript_21910/g.55231 Transcript_21910/m.55231 type:complete len:757 (-) Transcript_21910:724-2994(-)|eukprot:CAMPEP_0178995504 /NCGR_PEP_ID=MMETSP0795-20121207/7861_1 /TAXON_ID=88552 /ORGANISM="Amoebophrya sp., Strain Ameob2" /LENGTH=756 /DNA_ID=CAMNT_0020687813 /DNA_START=458 /DNA_END=2728 /DNA_ORIENTATION=-
MAQDIEKVLVVTSLDYFGAAALSVLHKCGYDNVLCVVCGGAQGLDVIAECRKHGYSNFVSDDPAMLKTVCESYKATLSVGLGDNLPKTSLSLHFKDDKSPLFKSGGSSSSSAAASLPPWPEFLPIAAGAESTKMEIRLAGAAEADAAAAADISVTGADTAISLRYKRISEFPALFEAALESLSAGLTAAAAAGALNLKIFDFISAAPALKTGTAAGGDYFVDPDAMSLEEADRFIRGCNFPPHEPAMVKSKLDNCDYYVDSMEHYMLHLTSIGKSTAGAPNSSVNLLGDCETTSTKQYSADTHWYSNVGGTIVKVQAETMKLRKKNEVAQIIPGQAMSAQAKKRLRMNEPLIGLTAHGYIQKALSSGWIGVEGPYIKKFEASIARICQVEAACAVQSGTAALYGAMKALGVSDSLHHVIVPTYTCAACADAIVHAGGIPIAVDCELDSYGLSFEAVRDTILADENIVGVVIAPCYGIPSRDHMKIHELCKEQGLWLCEDNCESYGAVMQVGDDGEAKTSATTDGARTAKVGSMSTMSVISVRSEKMVGVGEGGAILSKDAALVSKARWWCSRAPVRGCGLWRVYEHENIGQNYRLPELLGAVGLAACENLPVMIERKRNIHKWYVELLGDVGFLKFQQAKSLDQPVWWLNALMIETPAKLKLAAQFSGAKPQQNLAETVGMRLMKHHPHIEIRPAFFPLHKMSCFSTHARPCPNADFVYERLLCVPSSAQLNRGDIESVCIALRDSLQEVVVGDAA